jgi:hypothetical protein
VTGHLPVRVINQPDLCRDEDVTRTASPWRRFVGAAAHADEADDAADEIRQHGPMAYETGRATHVDPSSVQTREDVAEFLSDVLADFRSTGASKWENGTLDRFLDAFAAYVNSRLAFEPDYDQERASWRLFAEIVRATTGYE